MRRIKRYLVAAGFVLAALAALPPASVAEAAAPFWSTATSGCSQASLWKVAFLFERTANGKALPDDAIAKSADGVDGWAQRAGQYSKCGVQVQADFYESTDFPTGVPDPSAYDTYVTVYPSHGDEGYWGVTKPANGPGYGLNRHRIEIPVGTISSSSGEGPDGVNYVLMTHEWLHAVVFWYQPFGVVFPTSDVHGATEHGYPGTSDGNMAYFKDMMSGNVAESGRMTGITPAQWRSLPTPRSGREPKPVEIIYKTAKVKISAGKRRGRRVLFTVTVGQPLSATE